MSRGYSVFGRPAPAFPVFTSTLPWYGGDLQTIRNNLMWHEPLFPRHLQTRLTLPMNDGTGDCLTGLLDVPEQQTRLPLLILIHGLTGCEGSRNIMTSAAHFVADGFPVVRLNLRGAGPSLGRCQQHYHAGRSEDLAAALDGIPEEHTRNGIVLMGVSLGGNTVLKFAGERFHGRKVIAVASVCAPIDLKMAQLRIMAPRNLIYHRYLINRMKADALTAAPEEQKQRLAKTLAEVATVYDYDDRIVATDNGFDDAEDYYRKCSAKAFLTSIPCPTLLVHAATDPWIPVAMYLEQDWSADSNRTLVISDDGGHVGFHLQGHGAPWHNLAVSTFFKGLVNE